jgi:hypothetical protein
MTRYNKQLLAIGIPTYKRPDFAIQLIQKVLNFNIYDQIIISSNSNEKKLSQFINSLDNNKIYFYQQQENVGLAKNYLKVIELCNCEYLHVISDEDFPNERNTKELYRILDSNPSISNIVLTIHDQHNKIYKDATWQKHDYLVNPLGETTHIGSNIINNDMLGEFEINLLSNYCEREGSCYVTAAAALLTYSVGKNIKYFSKPLLTMGNLHDFREISGESIYSFYSRLTQFTSFMILIKELRLRKKTRIITNTFYYFSNHALQDSVRKYNEVSFKIFLNHLKKNNLTIDIKIYLLLLMGCFYFYLFYFKLRRILSKFLRIFK